MGATPEAPSEPRADVAGRTWTNGGSLDRVLLALAGVLQAVADVEPELWPTDGPRIWSDGRSRPTISVVIPAKNESENVAWVLARLPDYIDEVILVDGESIDGTVEVARALRPDLRVVSEPGRGKGAALRAGFESATSDVIVMIDADGSMHPQEIGRYLHLLEDGFDLVKGSRFMAGGGSTDITKIRQLGNSALVFLVNRVFGARFTDICYGFCAFRRDHLDALALDADGFEIETQLILRAVGAGLRITEVPSHEKPRRFGTSNLHVVRDGARIGRTIVRELARPGARPVTGPPATTGDAVIDLRLGARAAGARADTAAPDPGA